MELQPPDRDDIEAVLRNPQTRRFLWWVLSSCGIYATSFSESAAVAAFREGERNVGLKIIAEIGRSFPLAYAALAHEQAQEALKEAAAAAETQEPNE